MYVSLGCAYRNAPANTAVQLLEPFGSFKVQGLSFCADSGHMFEMYGDAMSQNISSDDAVLVSNSTGCASRSVFTSYPDRTFSFAALAMSSSGPPVPGQQQFIDYSWDEGVETPFVGTPFILVRGAQAIGAGCGREEYPSGEECDLLDGGDGLPAVDGQSASDTCSFTCHYNWCGDGHVDPEFGEECDNGDRNGRSLLGSTGYAIGNCTSFCKIPNIPNPNHPPVALCKNVTVVATNTCGVAANIDNGSFDQDNDLVGCTQSPASTYPIGNTLVTLTCTDAKNNSATCTGTVTVTDKVLPTVTLVGNANQSVECTKGGTYTDPGYSASDLCDGPLPQSSVTKTGAVAMGTPSSYNLTYQATDSSGNKSPIVTRAVTVADTLAPVIALNGSANVNQECGTAYADSGATATDQCEGTITPRIVKTGTVNTAVVNDYYVYYNVSDTTNHAAIQAVRAVFVRDTKAPTVTLVGPTSQTVECNGTFTDPGATATDSCNPPTPATSVNSSTLNMGVPGIYVINYKATDATNHTGYSGNRAVTVADTLAPTLTLLGSANMTQECAVAFTDPGATAADQCYGNTTSSIVKTGSVNNMVLGPYALSYNVKDPKNNAAPAVTRTVTVKDTVPPVITVTGPLSQNVECGSAYADPGAAANDACAGVRPAVATPPANPNVPGNYNVAYTSTDPSGNTTTSSSHRSVVVSDTLPPTLTLLGPAASNLECGTPYTDPGATANDQCAGVLTASVSKTGSVNSQVPGPYSLHYTVSDGNGHSTSADRSVTVRDTLAPTVTMTGALTVALECGAAYADSGATASDACAGPLPAVATSTPNPSVPNTYNITYKATDPSGNTGFSSGSRSVVVSDTLPPTVTLNGQALQNLECGSPYNELGATANDQCAGTLPVTMAGGVNVQIPADYMLIYSANDGYGHSASANRTVKVADTLPPAIAVMGALDQTYECGSTYADPGATANDACAGNLTSAIVATSSGNTTTPNTFTITYSVTDPSGNETISPAQRTVHVNDNAPPALALLGPATQNIECADPYTDPGAIANDACFGDVTSRIVRTGSVNNNVPGSYGLVYNVSDPAGQAAPPVSRTVNVADTKNPIVSVTGPLNVALECGAGPYSDMGATASDACAGALTAVATSTANPNVPGNYIIGYTATDPSGNVGVSASSRTVTVSDTLPPVLALNGAALMGLECATPFTDPGATANDQCAGNLPVTVAGSVNSKTLGAQTLHYSATDGAHTASADRTVTVSDTLSPNITVNGPLNDIFECGASYVDPGATAQDACAGALPVTSTRTGSPDHPGSFTITYSAVDPSGNSVTSPVTRTVSVADNEAPLLALVGPAAQAVECGSSYTDPGATAIDACFGDLTSQIVRTGSVNTAAPGNYPLTYNVSDPAGLSAPTLHRDVSVADTLAPTLTLLGQAHPLVECGTPYADPGATASDVCAGDLSSAITQAGSVNTAAPGNYVLSYSVVDPSGHGATATRPVSVQDSLAPQLQLNPGPSVLQCNGSTYVDPGATALDLCSGDLTASITSVSNLNQGQAGHYTITYSVADAAGHLSTAVRSLTVQGTDIHLSDYNLFLLEDYTGGHDVVGKVAAGGNITLSDFAVGSGLQDSDISKVLVAGGNLTLSRGGVWGDAFYGGTYSADSSVTYPRGTVAHGSPIDFAARFTELRSLSAQLGGRTATGSTTYESWGGIMLDGSSSSLNVFNVNASAFSSAKLFSINAPAGSLVVVNIRGATARFSGFGTSFSGGIDEHGVLYNFVDTTSITAQGFGFRGTVLAPSARVSFTNGSWDGGMYAVSLTGNAEGHINPLADRAFCQ
jgi:choice-of-anchor A domain-containing protein